MVVNTPFHKIYSRSFARVLYFVLMKDIPGRSMTPLDAIRKRPRGTARYTSRVWSFLLAALDNRRASL